MAPQGMSIEREFPARTDQLVHVRGFITDTLKNTKLPERDARAVVLAVDEAVSNTIMHGYKDRAGDIKIRIECDDKAACITIIDNGLRFDAAVKVGEARVDMKEHVATGARRGLGLLIMRKVMDEVKYAFKDGQYNELIMVKYLRPEIPELS